MFVTLACFRFPSAHILQSSCPFSVSERAYTPVSLPIFCFFEHTYCFSGLLSISTKHIILRMYQTTPPTTNEQVMWGGQSYSMESTTESKQPTMVPAQHDGFHAMNVNPTPHFPFIASSSDDLFHPTVNRPLNQPYFLLPPPVHHETPFNTTYIHPSDTFECISSFPPNF